MAGDLDLAEYGREMGHIAHDFNNLLTAINGYADLCMTQAPEDGPLRQWLDEVRRAGVRGSELALRLLELSRRQRDLVLQGERGGESPSGAG